MKIKLIAEIGCNHQGMYAQAIEMIKIIKKYCDVDHVKFQKRNPKKLLSKKEYNSPHPNAHNSFGKTYGLHREKLEFSLGMHKRIKDYCIKNKVVYSSSVWDVDSAKQIIKLKPKYIKIPSACNTDKSLLSYIFKNYNGEIHVSLGMTSKREEKEIINLAKKYKRNKDIILYACTSDYPVKAEDICLLEIVRLKNMYEKVVKGIGFSGHHYGISADIAAAALGARWVERHFTLDRAMKGTDHAASLEPEGLKKLRRDLNHLEKSFKLKPKEILTCEIAQRKKLKRFKK